MLDKKTLSIIIDARDRASRELKSVKRQLDRTTSASKTLARGFAVAGTAIAGAVGFGVTKAVQEASRVKEIDRLFDATFDETRGEVRQWADDMADEFGRADQDMRSLAATAGSVLAPAFDISEEELAEMVTGMGEAAVALAATDTRIDDSQQAMEGFTQALIGNRQRVIDWGFQVRDSQLKQIALEEGIIGTNEELTQQQKAMLTAQEIMDNVSVSQEVLKDSQDDWSQVSKRLNGQVKEVSETLGNIFLPILETAGKDAIDLFKDFNDTLSREDVQENLRNIGDAVADMLESGLETIIDLFKWGRDNWPQIAGAITASLAPALWSLAGAISGVMLSLSPLTVAGWILGSMLEDWIEESGGVREAMNRLRDKISAAREWVKEHESLIYGVVGAYATLKTTMKLQGALAAFSGVMGGARGQMVTTQGTIATTQGAFKTMAATMGKNIVISVTVGAAIAVLDKFHDYAMDQLNHLDQSLKHMRFKVNTRVERAREKIRNAETEEEEAEGARELYKAQNSPEARSPGQLASGTNSWRGGMTWVGEEGPELINLPKGSKVHSNEDSKKMVGNTTNINGNIIVDSQQRLDQLMDRLNKQQTMAANGMGS